MSDKTEWVLVPRVPTEAMETARRMYGDTSDWWNAVLQAAAQPPSGGESEPMTDAEVRKWIDACNHEPARQVLRDYLRLRTAPPSAPVGVDAVPVAWIRASMVETSTGEVGHLVRVGSEQEHPDDVPLYLAQQPAAVDESGGGWKPIDTAPLGIVVLVWSSTGPNTGGCMMAYRRKTDGQWCKEGGALLAELEGYAGWPTHWQELPPAPAAQPGGSDNGR